MPRLSLYRPNRTSDYQFLDRTISERFTVGGLDIFVHKYMGPIVDTTDSPGNKDATLPVYTSENPLFIEDLLLLENRDRAYDPNIYIMRGVYTHNDINFDLTQFGLFLNNDTLYITFHYNDMIDTFGRKLMAGDVLELPNLKDYNPLNSNITRALPKYYVIQDASFAAEGFSQTWLPHTWRVKATPMVNAQEYKQIMDQPFMPDNIWDNGNFYPRGDIVNDGGRYYEAKANVPPGTPITDPNYWALIEKPTTLGDANSTRNKDLALNDALIIQANADVPLSGYDNVSFYILPTTPSGQPSSEGVFADGQNITVDSTEQGEGETPKSFGYTMGYLTGDKMAPNGLPVTPGVSFPVRPSTGDYCLRLDYFPNRLFRYNGSMWIAISDDVRAELDWGFDNKTQRSSFVNNPYTVSTSDQGNIPSRQSLSELLKPEADNGNQGGNKPPNPRPPGR
ncbi:MAG: hypothetical protein EB127_04400 [Alphaproteobacteria bacterium]|nr:hypothetical protein [Alphaproteobacteria bacterium]